MTKICPDCHAEVLSTSQPASGKTELTPEHKLLCDVAAVKVHLDKYSRIEQRALLNRVMEHLSAVVETQRIAASQPEPEAGDLMQQPQYIIEYYKLGIYEELVYRVTAIGYGANTSTQVMLQTSVQGFTSK